MVIMNVHVKSCAHPLKASVTMDTKYAKILKGCTYTCHDIRFSFFSHHNIF